jgi:hypothetical protein
LGFVDPVVDPLLDDDPLDAWALEDELEWLDELVSVVDAVPAAHPRSPTHPSETVTPDIQVSHRQRIVRLLQARAYGAGACS